jgi:steroid 5-alpha reductase family enzyme
MPSTARFAVPSANSRCSPHGARARPRRSRPAVSSTSVHGRPRPRAAGALAVVGVFVNACDCVRLEQAWEARPNRHRHRTCSRLQRGHTSPRTLDWRGHHPPASNYFFEWCVWLGFAVYCLAFGAWGLLGLIGQAIIVASIFGVTGISPTENQALRSKGEAYRAYQARVSRFIPMPPKRARPNA